MDMLALRWSPKETQTTYLPDGKSNLAGSAEEEGKPKTRRTYNTKDIRSEERMTHMMI